MQAELQEARLVVRQAEAKKKQQAVAKQWARSPLAGQVVDVRVVDMSVSGVMLEVVLEEVKQPVKGVVAVSGVK